VDKVAGVKEKTDENSEKWPNGIFSLVVIGNERKEVG